MTRERSTSYPVLDLAAAYRVLRQDLSGLGSIELSRDEMAKRIGYQGALGGLAARKISALVQYGLLDRRVGLYGLSPLGIRIQAMELGDASFPSAIRSALERPPLFKEILRRYQESGKVPQNLATELSDFGITQRASDHAAEVFRSSALFAGVIDTEGIFQDGSERTVLTGGLLPVSESAFQQSGDLSQEWDEIPLLLTNKRTAFLRLPTSLTTEDYLALKDAFLGAYKLLPKHLGLQLSSKGTEKTKSRGPESPLRFPGRKNS